LFKNSRSTNLILKILESLFQKVSGTYISEVNFPEDKICHFENLVVCKEIRGMQEVKA